MATQPPPLPPGFVLDTPPPPAAPRSFPRQPAPRTPEQAVVERGQAEAAPYAAPRAATDLRRTQQQITQTDTRGVNFDGEQGLRNQYQRLEPVLHYQGALPIAQSAMETSPDGPGDLSLVIAYTKVMDPGTASREGEVAAIQGSGSVADQAAGFRQYITGNGQLSPAMRANIRRQIQNRLTNYRLVYNQVRDDYRRRAERYGFDPQSILGSDPGEAFVREGNSPLDVAEAAVAGITGGIGGIQEPSASGPSAVPVAPGTGGAPNASGGITTTDRSLSAQSRSYAADPVADPLERGNTDIRISTPLDAEYNRAWVQAVNSGLDRDGLNSWLQENYQRFYPGATVPEVGDPNWRLIEDSRRTGTGIDWRPNARSINQLPDQAREAVQGDYDAQVTAREGADARREWAAENPGWATLDTIGRTAANTVTLGLANRVSGTLSGRGAAFENGASQADWEDRPLQSLGGAMLGGSRLPFGQGIVRQTGIGSAYGGVTAFNESDGPIADRLGAAYRGAATGGAANLLLGGATRAFRSPNADAVIEAGQRQNVYVPRYMTGRETAQVGAGMVGATPGRIPMAMATNRTIRGIETARNRAASEIGDVGQIPETGRRLQSGARAYLDRTQERAEQLYSRIPIRPEVPAELSNTRAALSELTEGMSSNPKLSALFEDQRLLSIRGALAEGGDGLSWADQKRLRSLVGEMIGQQQVAGEVTSRAALRRLYGALTDDMRATAEAQGPRALAAFDEANTFWRRREARREGVISEILGADGKRNADDAFRQVNRWANRNTSNTVALAQTLRSLPKDDANAVRATIFGQMGRATRGAQDETGEAFSPQVFASQWANLTPRAKSLLVPNRGHRRNLDDIALLTSAMRRSERFTNTSNTGLGVSANFGALGLAGWAGGPPLAIKSAAAALLAGRMLSTPAGSATFLRALRNPEAFRDLVTQEEEGGLDEQGR